MHNIYKAAFVVEMFKETEELSLLYWSDNKHLMKSETRARLQAVSE